MIESRSLGILMLPDRISRLLTAYVDGELSAREREAVVRLLDQSSEARELLHALQNDADQLRSLPRQTLAPDFSQRILQAIASRNIKAGHRSPVRVPLYASVGFSLATAAAVLLLIGFGSYVYIVTVDRQQRAKLALMRAADPQATEQRVIESAANVTPAPKTELRERLGPPTLQSEAKAAPSAVASGNEVDKSFAGTSENLKASPVRPESRPLKDLELPFVFTCNVRDLNQAAAKQQLQQRLQKGAAYRMDLRCSDTLMAVQRLHKALEAHGVRCVIDRDAGALLKLAMGRNTPLALYFEDVTADEITTVLQQLGSEDGKPEVRRRGRGVFDVLVLRTMTPEDQQKVPWELGIDPAQLDAPMPKEQVRFDSRKPLLSASAKESADRPKGQGGARAESRQPVVQNLERQALVVVYTPGRPRQISEELKPFLDARKERRAGGVQILLVLTPAK
jgi:anti-sigma factor RsiW